MGSPNPTTPQASSAQLSPTPPAWRPALLIAAGLAGALVSLAFLSHGKPLAEKTLTALIMPVGAAWLVTSGRLMQMIVLRRLHQSKMLLCFWLVLAICGTRPLPSALTYWLESSVSAFEPGRDGVLDVVVVLGGGTSNGPWRAQAGAAGDRVLMAAQLYLQGHAKQLVTTGEATPGVSRTMVSPAEQTVEIWTSLGIPRTAIMTLGGQNTAGEIASLKRAWPKFAGKRVGLLTSANHLPRALRLAGAQELELIAVAANVKWSPEPIGLLDFIPQAGNLSELAASQHEIMAYFVRR